MPSKACIYLFSIDGGFPDVHAVSLRGTSEPLYHQRCRLLN